MVLNLATWNVKTLLQPGKLNELKNEIEKTNLDIVAVQETRWSGKGHIRKNNFTFYYGGPNNKTGQAGTGFLIKNKIRKACVFLE